MIIEQASNTSGGPPGPRFVSLCAPNYPPLPALRQPCGRLSEWLFASKGLHRVTAALGLVISSSSSRSTGSAPPLRPFKMAFHDNPLSLSVPDEHLHNWARVTSSTPPVAAPTAAVRRSRRHVRLVQR